MTDALGRALYIDLCKIMDLHVYKRIITLKRSEQLTFRQHQHAYRQLERHRAWRSVSMAPVDPHSYADSSQPFATHAALILYVDFPASVIHGFAALTLPSPHSGDLTLDSRSLSIHAVVDPTSLSHLPFSLFPAAPDPIKGQSLTVSLSSHTSFIVVFTTSPSSSALQWLYPPQTFSAVNPFVYTQCQAIHARSVFPCQDTPAARLRYSAVVNLPRSISAVMSAARVSRRDPSASDFPVPHPYLADSSWCSQERVVEVFEMEHPIPPYLFALAAGSMAHRDVGPRTTIYVEGGSAELEAATHEFCEVEELIRVGESLFSPYEWERFDVLVLPRSFPYGGMENPRTVFLTPTVIKGDGTGAHVLAHELAHSWTGNLITNKTNEDFWLNEGFTTYAERRIVEAVQGKEQAELCIGIGWKGLNEEMERFKNCIEFTKLKTKQDNIHPDDIYSQVPYEKGFQFLYRIEREIGRPAFDAFLKNYISTFKFQSITTETFIEFLVVNIPGIEKQIDLKLWVEGTGIPPDALEPVSGIYTKILVLAKEFDMGRMPTKEEVLEWSGLEWQLYLENLPKTVNVSQVVALDELFNLANSNDWEVKVAFLHLAVASGERKYLANVEKALKQVGRMKYLRPLYTVLAKSGAEEDRMLACSIFREARPLYHPIAQAVVESILSKNVV